MTNKKHTFNGMYAHIWNNPKLLKETIQNSDTIKEVFQKLGIQSKQYGMMYLVAEYYKIDMLKYKRFVEKDPKDRIFKGKHADIWNDVGKLKAAKKQAISKTDMLRILGITYNSGNFQTLKAALYKHGIKEPANSRNSNTLNASVFNRIPDAIMFSDRGVKAGSAGLIKRMVEDHNIPYECVHCKNDGNWNGKKITLELDHIDGNCFNNILTNLRILCPNCHSQTDNFRGRNVVKAVYNYCIDCSKRIHRDSIRCREHANNLIASEKHTQTVNRYGSIENLYELYKELNTMVAVGKHYNVSDNVIRKYIRKFGITMEDFKQGILQKN